MPSTLCGRFGLWSFTEETPGCSCAVNKVSVNPATFRNTQRRSNKRFVYPLSSHVEMIVLDSLSADSLGQASLAAPRSGEVLQPVSNQFQVKQYLARLIGQFSAFTILYVFSIGPMFWYWHAAKYADGSRFFVAFYAPLMYACEVEFVCTFVNWYINLWIF